MSITFFSVFFPEIFHTEIKNKFITDKQKQLSPKQNPKKLPEKLNTECCKTNFNNNSIFNKKTKYFRTSENISTYNTNLNINNNNTRNMIHITPSKPKLKSRNKKPKYSLYQAINEKIQPYKQYLIERRQLEKIKKEKTRYKNELMLKKKELLTLPPKNKIKGINFATQKGFGFFDQYVESKNYSKEKIKNKKPVFIIKRKKFDEFDMELFEDIKNGKRKNVFEEKYDIKSFLRYDRLKQSAFGFLKYLNENPNFNY